MQEFIASEKIINRLNRIAGQIQGLIKMVQDGKECEEVLIQISAVKSALHKTGQTILEEHLQHCVVDGIKNGDEAKTLKKLTSAIEYFSRMV